MKFGGRDVCARPVSRNIPATIGTRLRRTNTRIFIPSTPGTLGTLGSLGTLGTLGTPGTPGTLGTLGTPGTPGTLFVILLIHPPPE